MGLAGISPQLPALRQPLLLGVRAAAGAARPQYLSRSRREAPLHHPPQRSVLFTVRHGLSCSVLTISLSGNFDRAQAYSKRDKSEKVTPLGQRLKGR